MSIRVLLSTVACLACLGAAATEPVDHLVPEPGTFASRSYEFDAFVRRGLYEKATDKPDFQIVVVPAFEFEWMLSGNSRSSVLTEIRANGKITRGREVQLTTASKALPPPLMRRLRALVVGHLATVRYEAEAIEDLKAGEQPMTKVVMHTDLTYYHFVARAISATTHLSGQMNGSGLSLTALKAVIASAADFVHASGDAEKELAAFQQALGDAERKLEARDRQGTVKAN